MIYSPFLRDFQLHQSFFICGWSNSLNCFLSHLWINFYSLCTTECLHMTQVQSAAVHQSGSWVSQRNLHSQQSVSSFCSLSRGRPITQSFLRLISRTIPLPAFWHRHPRGLGGATAWTLAVLTGQFRFMWVTTDSGGCLATVCQWHDTILKYAGPICSVAPQPCLNMK